MSEQPPAPGSSALSNPQVIAAIVGGIVTVIVAVVGIVPAIIANQNATPVVVTATPIPAATVAVVLPTSPPPTAVPVVPTEAQVQLTAILFVPPTDAQSAAPDLPSPVFPSATVPPENPPTQAAAPNVLLMYDDVSFTLLNQTARTLSLEGVVFRSPGGEWEARKWGPSIYNSLPAGKCLRLRDAAVGQRQPPASCVNRIYALQEVGTPAFFWKARDRFEVLRNGEVIASCAAADGQCSIYVP